MLHLFDALHPCYAGDLGIGPNPKLLARIKAADLVVLVGGRMGEMPSQGYTLFDIPRPQMTFVHVHPGAEELGRVYRAHLPINATPTAFAAALEGLEPPNGAARRRRRPRMPTILPGRSSRPSSRARSTSARSWCGCAKTSRPTPSSATAPATTPPGCIASTASAVSASILAPTSGSMGYGVPAAVAMKRLYPERTVVCVAGDGDFLMNGQEFATAVQYGLPIIVLIADNGMYGTIRMHQEREYPGRIIATALRNPDFAAYARAFGGFGASVEKTADFPAAFNAGTGVRQAGDHPPEDRSGGDHAGNDARQDPREVAGGERASG